MTNQSDSQQLDGILDAFLELLAQRVAEKLGGKEVYTYAELAERYGVSVDTIQRRAAAGEFGELVCLGTRKYRVTAAGVRQFESARGGKRKAPDSAAPGGRHRAARRDPGPI